MNSINPFDGDPNCGQSISPGWAGWVVIGLIALLALATHGFAAGTDTNGLDNISPPGLGHCEQTVVGKVTLRLTNTDLHISGSNVNLILDWPENRTEGYVGVVRNPFAEPRLEDGFLVNDANFQEFKDYKELQATHFTRFAFFTNRPTTIGLMTGHAGADGSSSQTLYLVDVETGTHVGIPMADGDMPMWLQSGVYPPAFALTDNYGIQSDVAWSPGGKPRLTQVYLFRNGQYHRDWAAERKEMAARFQAAQLTPAEWQRIQAAKELDLAEERDLERLLDFIHYGRFTGQAAAVNRQIKVLPKEWRKRLTESRDWTEAQNGIDRVDEAGQGAQAGGPDYVYVHSGDTLYGIAREWARYGVTVEGMRAANPGIRPERLQVGQIVLLSTVAKPEESERWVEVVQAAARRGVDYIKVMKRCWAKDRAAMSQFFQLVTGMDGIAAEEYGCDLQNLQQTLGAGFFDDCLSHESAALQEEIRECLSTAKES